VPEEEPKSSWASDLDEPYVVELGDVVSELEKLESRVGDVVEEVQKLDQLTDVVDAVGHVVNDIRSTLRTLWSGVSVFLLLILIGIFMIVGTLRHWF
jgi:hypothetical protein